MKRKPIVAYCKQDVEGWLKLPNAINAAPPGEEEFTCGFLRQSDGVHMLASVKTLNDFNFIHVSLTPIRVFRQDWTDEEHSGHLFDIAFEAIKSFFPDRKFAQQPVDPRRPEMKHYFSPISHE